MFNDELILTGKYEDFMEVVKIDKKKVDISTLTFMNIYCVFQLDVNKSLFFSITSFEMVIFVPSSVF